MDGVPVIYAPHGLWPLNNACGRFPCDADRALAGSAYATSKAALSALTREMAADFGPYGVRVNAIAPGEIDTSILSPGTEELVKQIPLRRLGEPEEVAEIIFFLCSEESSYVSGAEIHVNGGQHV